MREVKFRQFIHGKMFFSGFIHSDESFTSPHTVTNKFPVMQYTGLKDKNGKDIYEGDIVMIDDSFFIVKYFNAGFCLFKSNKDEAWRLENWEDLRSYAWCCEIYGNVYENKDLLND